MNHDIYIYTFCERNHPIEKPQRYKPNWFKNLKLKSEIVILKTTKKILKIVILNEKNLKEKRQLILGGSINVTYIHRESQPCIYSPSEKKITGFLRLSFWTLSLPSIWSQVCSYTKQFTMFPLQQIPFSSSLK